MDTEEFLNIMHRAEKLKCNTRHSWTSSGRHESVAEHSWRLCLMAMLLEHELKTEFPEADFAKILRMCVIHDLGEAFTGDIPAFEKSEADGAKEERLLEEWMGGFSQPYGTEMCGLLREMDACSTAEARIYKALDKLEAVIQHNEADIGTWLPLEYDLQLSYAEESTGFSSVLHALKEQVNADTRKKIRAAGNGQHKTEAAEKDEAAR